jgi:hypothetical protein
LDIYTDKKDALLFIFKKKNKKEKKKKIRRKKKEKEIKLLSDNTNEKAYLHTS